VCRIECGGRHAVVLLTVVTSAALASTQTATSTFTGSVIATKYHHHHIITVADYPLGRIGSCLRPGMVRGPGPFKEKREKCFFKHVFHYFIISKLLCIVFMLDVHVFVKQHKLVDLVQYIVLVETESIFCFYCITVRPAIYLCLRPEIS